MFCYFFAGLRSHRYNIHKLGDPVNRKRPESKKEKNVKIQCYFPNCDHFTEFTHYQHMTEKHRGSNTCETCGVKSKGLIPALRHQAKVHGHMMKCKACGKEYTNYNGFRTHWLEHEQATKTHICETCGCAYHHKWDLNEHIKRHHERKYKCDLCDFKHGRKWNLKVHMRSHKNKQI